MISNRGGQIVRIPLQSRRQDFDSGDAGRLILHCLRLDEDRAPVSKDFVSIRVSLASQGPWHRMENGPKHENGKN